MKKRTDEEINILRRALRVAAVEAYQTELAHSPDEERLIGQGKPFASVKEWFDFKIETWLQEAELRK